MGHAATVGFALSTLSLIGILFCIISPEWKKNSKLSSQQSLQNIYHSQGLWMRCSIPTPGNLQCDNYGTTLFNVPAYLQALRAMMILATLFMFMACTLDCLAMDCVNCIEPRTKMWMARIGGIGSILAGILTIAAVSWYASEVIKQFNLFNAYNDSIKYTFGAALYVGWIAGGVGLISGAVTLCCSCFSDDYEVEDYRPAYKPKVAKMTTEYV